LPHLKTIIAGGEPCPQALVQRWGRCRDFFNAYGPTEGTVTAPLHRCNVTDERDPPIGGPRDGVRVHVLDAAQEPVAEGEVGELYIGGAGVARGYLGRADWTASRFMPEPGIADGDRMYRTGDLVSRQATGRLEFVGRSDRQVKIRGTRVELGEVEAVLSSHPALLQVAAVVCDDRGDRRMVAYYREAVDGTTTSRDLRSWLGQRLPPQMLPSRFVPVAELPLAPSGKVDYSALSQPGVLAPSDGDMGETDKLSSPSVRPRMTAREAQLHSLWCAVIGLPPDELSIDDHFVEVGGDSVLSVRIADALETQGLSVRAQDLLDHGSIRRLAEAIDSRGEPR
jgi:acyl-coenzyme A synthetase/AMP-(fatty) acid ligase